MKLFLASSLDKAIGLLETRIPKAPKETKVLFVANAADPFDDKWWVEADRQAFIKAGYQGVEGDLKKPEEFLLQLKSVDVLHLCGGSVFYLLSLLQQHNLGNEIVRLVKGNRIIYTGTSAGSIVPSSSTEIYKHDPEEKKFVSLVTDFSGLNLVNFVVSPHCNNPAFVEANKAIVEHVPEFPTPLIFLHDGQVVWVEDGKLEILSGVI